MDNLQHFILLLNEKDTRLALAHNISLHANVCKRSDLRPLSPEKKLPDCLHFPHHHLRGMGELVGRSVLSQADSSCASRHAFVPDLDSWNDGSWNGASRHKEVLD
ncbi:uncharacterized [Tachysurus ichikawai]